MKASLAIIFVSLGLAAASPTGFTQARFPDIRIGVPPQDYSGEGRIIGGEEVEPHSIPYQVALIINGVSFCGGSIISKDVILTAGHCTTSATFIQVRLGAHNQSDANEEGQQRVTSTNIKTHENYGGTLLRNDIGLVYLPTDITFDQYIQPATLSKDTIGEGVDVTASGWGKSFDDGNVEDLLRYVNITTISNAKCSETFGSLTVNNGVLCTDGADKTGTCNGDSGGPLVLNTATQYQVGLTSFGSSAGCEEGYPVGFTRLSNFAVWIETYANVTLV